MEIKRMTDKQLLIYFSKLIESGCKKDHHERAQAFDEIMDRLKSTKYEVKEKGIIEGKPANILLFTNQEALLIAKCIHSKLNEGLEEYTYEEIQNAFEKMMFIQKIVSGDSEND